MFISRILLSDQYSKLFLNNYSCNLAKFQVSILDPLTRNQYRVKISVSLSALLQTLELKEPIHIASFDISSLLTHISLDKTIEPVCNKIFTYIAFFCELSGENFKNSLNWNAKTFISFQILAFTSSTTEWQGHSIQSTFR